MTAFDAALRKLADDMAETMRTGDGIGLAAQQIGQAIQFCVIDMRPSEAEFDWEIDGRKPPLDLCMPSWLSPTRRSPRSPARRPPTRRAASPSPASMPTSSAPTPSASSIRSRRHRAHPRLQRPVLPLRPTRGRPSQRRALHRPHGQARRRRDQARAQGAREGNQGRRQEAGEIALPSQRTRHTLALPRSIAEPPPPPCAATPSSWPFFSPLPRWPGKPPAAG